MMEEGQPGLHEHVRIYEMEQQSSQGVDEHVGEL